MLHDVKWSLGRLLRNRWRARHASSAPRLFGDDEFFRHLREPADAIEEWRAGRHGAAWDVAVDYFRRREPPLGFVEPERIPALLVDVRQRFPGWPERLLAKVHEERHQGLAVYDRRAGPLSAHFDWSLGGGGPLGDRLYGVRPHRFGFLPRWALACHYDQNLVTDLKAVLDGWLAAADEGGGHPSFKSSHVVVYHFVAVVLAWPFLAALDGDQGDTAVATLKRLAIQTIYEGSRFMRAVDSGGVANNHRLAERFADWLTAALLPEFDHALTREHAETAWLDELHRQTYDDGGSIEHSVHYQEHACEMAVAYLLLSRRNGWSIPRQTLVRIEHMLRFQLAVAGPALLPLGLGNTTEDPLLALGVGESWQCGFLREIQRACFTSAVPTAPDDDASRETAFWMLDGKLGNESGTAVAEAVFQDFPESGVSVFAEPAASARLVFRLGPLPENPGIGGHSHSDLLSLYLSVGDAMVLAPPGTYSYRWMPHPDLPGQPNLHEYFAGASCRTGFFIDGLEPYGHLKGDFRNWRLPCQVVARRASSPEAGLSWVEGVVVGEGAYVGQRRGVVHIWGRGWLVYDRPPALASGRTAAFGWQFAPGVACRPDGDGIIVAENTASSTVLHLVHCGTGKATIMRGGFKPFRGWVSPSYGRLEPADNLRFPLSGDRSGAAFFLAPEAEEAQRLEQLTDGGEGLVIRMTAAKKETLLLLSTAERPAVLRWADVVFHGRVLCLCRDGRGINVRALGFTQLLAPSWGIDLRAQEPVDFDLVIADGEAHWPRGPCYQLKGGPLS